MIDRLIEQEVVLCCCKEERNLKGLWHIFWTWVPPAFSKAEKKGSRRNSWWKRQKRVRVRRQGQLWKAECLWFFCHYGNCVTCLKSKDSSHTLPLDNGATYAIQMHVTFQTKSMCPSLTHSCCLPFHVKTRRTLGGFCCNGFNYIYIYIPLVYQWQRLKVPICRPVALRANAHVAQWRSRAFGSPWVTDV